MLLVKGPGLSVTFFQRMNLGLEREGRGSSPCCHGAGAGEGATVEMLLTQGSPGIRGLGGFEQSWEDRLAPRL